jgi:hypothetical protein
VLGESAPLLVKKTIPVLAVLVGWIPAAYPAQCATAIGNPYDPPRDGAVAANGLPPGAQVPFRDALMPPLPTWKGHSFRLSQQYPASIPPESQPWLAFDPVSQPSEYLKAVLAYFYEGNIQSSEEYSFDPALNPVRRWYQAPWLDYGINGREFVHGLTRERTSVPGELSPQQKQSWSNYAISYCNAPGGYLLGQIWADHQHPDPTAAPVPEGTVTVKLFFTTAPVAEVPQLAGAPQWQAYIYRDPHDPKPTITSPRRILPVSLLQIEVAVKDRRSLAGWVFGTFAYGGGPAGAAGEGWTNIRSAGLGRGNDPGFSGQGVSNDYLQVQIGLEHFRESQRMGNAASSSARRALTRQFEAFDEIPPQTGGGR